MNRGDIEVEVKFHIPDLDSIRNKIIQLGAESRGRVFETNIRFEDANGSLKRRQSILRLRQDTSTRLTYKANLPDSGTQFKIRKELEVTVDSFATMKQILEAIGFHKEQIYEKWRETLILDDIQFCLDTMPFGHFLEIEGEKAQIRTMADKLGLSWHRRILGSYMAIFQVIRQAESLDFHDITFANFASVTVDITKYLPIIEAEN